MLLKTDNQDYQFMARALELAKKGLYTTKPNPRVGCVIVNNGKIIGEGFHKKAGTEHAEKIAILEAGEKAKGATAYVTLEPCCHEGKTPPCTDLLIKAGISSVIAAMEDPNPQVKGNGFKQLEKAGIKVFLGPLEDQARALNCGFISRMKNQRPYVRLKLAMSIDGKTAMSNGESKWITCEESRLDAQKLRARSSAVITGINTVLFDNPSLNIRPPVLKTSQIDDENIQPLRVILDSDARVPLASRILTLPGKKLVAVGENADQKKIESLKQSDVNVIHLPTASLGLDLKVLLNVLAEMEQNEILFECGSTLAGSAVQEGIVDEMIVYKSSSIMGNNGKDSFFLPELEKISDKFNLNLKDVRMIGEDMKLFYTFQ